MAKQNPFLSRTIGLEDKGSRSKADSASNKANKEAVETENSHDNSWPIGSKGTPMMKAEMSVAELIPTGQYANVSIGPARLHFLVDPDRELADGESYFSEEQRAIIAKALNEVCDVIAEDVIAVQRNLVMESIQEQLSQR